MSDRDPLIGTMLDGRYRIEQRVGTGGMAAVYRAEDTTLGRQVAIKLLDNRHASDAQFVERFLREASSAARLNHPNIVQVYDRGEADGTYYIAMEYVEGTTLKQRIGQRAPLPEQEVLDLGRQALTALRFAHRNGIVHRDIKPHNMMVTSDGRLKIADFGIARAGADTGLTEVGSIVGTAQYLSPEQARGEVVAASSDLYSLGVVMFEMATGKVPFDGDNPVTVALRHVNEAPRRPSDLRPSISAALESVIMRALQKDPDLRYQTADEFLADIDVALSGGMPTETATMTRVIGSRPGQAPAAAATRAYRDGRPAQPPIPADPWNDHAADTDDDDKGKRRLVWILVALALLAAILVGWVTLGDNSSKKTPTTTTVTRVSTPDLAGMTLAQARNRLDRSGLELGAITKRFSEEERGTVLEQDPEPGDKVDEGTKVAVTVSQGLKPVDVPDIVGATREEAEKELQNAGLKASFRTEYNDGVESGSVIRQNPAAGTKVDPGSVVTVVVSRGSELSPVPDVVGMTKANARSRLEAEGFKVTIVTGADGPDAADEVISQDPRGGAEAEKDSSVTITIASGFNTVPSVDGLSESAASSKLRDAGFSVKVVAETSNDPSLDPEGEVTEQLPAQGQRLQLGSQVTITVTSPEPTSTTP